MSNPAGRPRHAHPRDQEHALACAVGSFEACADGSFELVVCQQGRQFMPDRLAALREIHRVLCPEASSMSQPGCL
ncbi:MAG: methyltransferase domain-containing protein [Solirubrobacterales bacterium]|nr:methyltransferase domain-containing protein [Solirubrobacterales bacterium]